MQPIIHKELAQHSNEWFNLRHNCILTASEFKEIITEKTHKVSSAKTLQTLAKRKAILHQKSYEEIEQINEFEGNTPFKNNHMERGCALEAEARQKYEQHYKTKVIEVGFITSPCKRFGYSPDGLINDDGLIEIKAPAFVKHTMMLLEDKAPTEYYAQLQGGLMITNRKWIDLVCYNNFARPRIERVTRDEGYITTLKEGLKQLTQYYEEYKGQIQEILNN